MKFMVKLLKVLLVLVAVAAILALFVWVNGVQYTLAFVTRGFGNPYFEVSHFSATPNCNGSVPCDSGPMKIMTYNVLCRACGRNGYDSWDVRLPHLRDVIGRYNPDLLGLQELGGEADINAFLGLFPEYACVSYRFGRWTYGDAALFYRADRFEALESGQMWLSPKPTLPFGFGWKALSVPRYVNWVYLKQKSNGFRFLYVNTHFDNNAPNKEPSALLFADTFRPIAAKMPIIATGDFNTPPTTQRYTNLKNGTRGEPVFADTMGMAPAKEMVAHGSGVTDPEEIRSHLDVAEGIDHIFLAGPQQNEVIRWVEDASVYGPDNRWPSDHPAVFAEVNLHSS